MKDKILELRKNGLSFTQISNELGCAKSTISYHCKKNGLSYIGLDELKKIKRGSKICKGCGLEFSLNGINKERIFCSRNCYHSSEYLKDIGRSFGLKSCQNQKENRRSKNEVYFYELCKNHFKSVKSNEDIFNGWDADVIIEDIKFAILWNGKWHYEK